MTPEAEDRQPLERFRSYLLLLARRQLQGRALPPVEALGRVQST